jgi:hypothetical protein
MVDSEAVNKSTARPDLAPALLAVPLCTGPLLGATSGRSRRFLHSLSGDRIVNGASQYLRTTRADDCQMRIDFVFSGNIMPQLSAWME